MEKLWCRTLHAHILRKHNTREHEFHLYVTSRLVVAAAVYGPPTSRFMRYVVFRDSEKPTNLVDVAPGSNTVKAPT